MMITGGNREWLFVISPPTTTTDVEVWLAENGHKSEDAIFLNGVGESTQYFLVADPKLAKKLTKLVGKVGSSS